MLAIRQRMRAPLKFAVPCSRTSQQGTCRRSAATDSRRVAVKSSAAGSPQISPTTALSPEHRRPSSIAHKASRASRAVTWMRGRGPSPAGWIRPASRIAIRSWIQSRGFPLSSCGSRKPAQPPSRGDKAKTSESVGCSGAGRQNGSPNSLRRGRFSAARSCAVEPSGGRSAARNWPPATRVRPAATRLLTNMFYFCSYSCETGNRVKVATRKNQSATTRAGAAGTAGGANGASSGGLPSISVRKVRISATTRLSAGR